jgi:hypothetical protein
VDIFGNISSSSSWSSKLGWRTSHAAEQIEWIFGCIVTVYHSSLHTRPLPAIWVLIKKLYVNSCAIFAYWEWCRFLDSPFSSNRPETLDRGLFFLVAGRCLRSIGRAIGRIWDGVIKRNFLRMTMDVPLKWNFLWVLYWEYVTFSTYHQ